MVIQLKITVCDNVNGKKHKLWVREMMTGELPDVICIFNGMAYELGKTRRGTYYFRLGKHRYFTLVRSFYDLALYDMHMKELEYTIVDFKNGRVYSFEPEKLSPCSEKAFKGYKEVTDTYVCIYDRYTNDRFSPSVKVLFINRWKEL